MNANYTRRKFLKKFTLHQSANIKTVISLNISTAYQNDENQSLTNFLRHPNHIRFTAMISRKDHRLLIQD